MAVTAVSKVVKIKTKQRKPSKQLQQEIEGFVIDLGKAKDRASRILELGRKEGFTDVEIGKLVRQALKEAGYSAMTAWRVLPSTARQKQDHNHHRHSSYDHQKVNKMLTFSDTTQEKRHKPGKWNMDPDEYEIEHLQEYDIDYLREIVRWYDKNKNDMIKEAFKWQARLDLYKARVNQLERDNQALKEENERLKQNMS